MNINLSVFNGVGTCEENYEILRNSCNELIGLSNFKVLIACGLFLLIWFILVGYYEKKIKNIKKEIQKEN